MIFLLDIAIVSLMERAQIMRIADPKLAKRVTSLERELQKLKVELKTMRQGSPPPWWERCTGVFKNDPLFDDMVEAGRAYRQSLAPRGRR